MQRTLALLLYVVFVAALVGYALSTGLRDFDRTFMKPWCATIRGCAKNYPIVKRENPERRPVLFSIVPSIWLTRTLYAIRPLYLKTIEVVAQPVYRTTTSTSFSLSVLESGWSCLAGRPARLLRSADGIPLLSCWAESVRRTPYRLCWCCRPLGPGSTTNIPGVLLLLASIWVRTDNILIVLLVFACCRTGKLSLSQSAILGVVAAASVLVIQHFP